MYNSTETALIKAWDFIATGKVIHDQAVLHHIDGNGDRMGCLGGWALLIEAELEDSNAITDYSDMENLVARLGYEHGIGFTRFHEYFVKRTRLNFDCVKLLFDSNTPIETQRTVLVSEYGEEYIREVNYDLYCPSVYMTYVDQ